MMCITPNGVGKQRRLLRLVPVVLSTRAIGIAGLFCAWAAVAPALASAASVGGSATYPDGSAAAGIDVSFAPSPHPPGAFRPPPSALTDGQGNWHADIPAGSYTLTFLVIGADGSNRNAASQSVTLADDVPQSLTTTVTGPPGAPQARLSGAVMAAGLPVSGHANVSFQSTDGSAVRAGSFDAPADGIAAELPAGSYTATVDAPSDADAISASFPIALSAGQVAVHDVSLPALAIPPAIHSTTTEANLANLNTERARWGMPSGLTANQTWSDACAAHDAYEQANHVLDHPESPGAPGFSPGGNWGGTHSILAGVATWTATANPWEDAPIHLNQLMTPDLSVIGIDASRGNACATTFPGMLLPVAAPGTVLTYPGDGTTGLPPAENAQEAPFVPGQFVDIPKGTIAGRELFIYEEGNAGSISSRGVSIANATLTGPSGPVEVRWVDSTTTGIGPFITGGIILPVKPLAPNTTYTAQVILNAFGGTFDTVIPAVSHEWSFVTGAANPTGAWPGGPNDPTSTATAKAPRITGVRMSNRRFRVASHASTHKARAPRGTAFRFNLSAQATVTIAIAPQSGLLRGKRCVRASASLRRAHAKRCSPVRQIGHLARANVGAGSPRLNFSGKLGQRPLAPGRYQATLTAQNAKGNSRPATVRFQIVR